MFSSRTLCATCRSRVFVAALRPVAHQPRIDCRESSTSTITSQHGPAPTEQTASADKHHATTIPTSARKTNRALDLFESTVSAAAATSAPAAAALEEDPVEILTRQINKIHAQDQIGDLSPGEASAAWHSLITELLQHMPQAQADRPALLPNHTYRAAVNAIGKILDFKGRSWNDPHFPSSKEIYQAIVGLKIKRPSRFDPIVGLLQWLIVTAPQSAASARVGDPTKDAQFDDELVQDLLACWVAFSASKESLQTPNKTREKQFKKPRTPPELEYLNARFPVSVRTDPTKLVVTLVTTYVVLSDPRASVAASQAEVFHAKREELGSLVRTVDKSRLESYFFSYPNLWHYVCPRVTWSDAPRARPQEEVAGSDVPADRKPKIAPNKTDAGAISYGGWNKKLNALFRNHNVAGLQKAWVELTIPPNDPNRAAKLRQCPELFDFIINQCCKKYGRQDQAFRKLNAEVLEYMTSIDLQPTLRTYTSMIEGWKHARRLGAIGELWGKIRASGMKLDEHIWSSWISSQGMSNQPMAGMRALEEMDQAWQKAVKQGHPDQGVKPGIASVNAAIGGLLRNDRLDTVQTVLAWAGSKGIEPDIYTYNALLGYTLKKGLMKEADTLFASMKASNVVPDAATFTIIIETALAEIKMQKPEAQRATITKIFVEMKAMGIEPNQSTYAKMLHVLMQAGDAARVPIEAVLSELRGSGLQPSAQICTILFEYYMARQPRDWDAIRDLIRDRRSRTRVLTDRVFWETVMRHFQEVGDTSAALEIFYDMDEWGIWVTLPTLEPILRSLIASRQWDEAHKLAAQVKKQARPAAEDPEGRYWKSGFWAVARDNGIIVD